MEYEGDAITPNDVQLEWESMNVNYHSLFRLSLYNHLDAKTVRRLRSTIDPNDEVNVKGAIKHYIAEPIMSIYFWPIARERLRRNLSYFLTKGNFGGVDADDELTRFEAIGAPPFRFPDTPMNYYRWAWEVLFPGEDYHLEALNKYVEENRFETA